MRIRSAIGEDIRYGYAVGRVRVLDGRLLSRTTFERLLDAPDLREQKRILADTHVGRYLEPALTASEIERGLEASLSDLYDDFLERAELPAAVVTYFQSPHDFANLRVAVKARVFGEAAVGSFTTLGAVPPDAFDRDGRELPRVFRELLTAWDEAAEAPAADEVETAIDRAMFAMLADAARASGVRFLRDLTALRIDAANARLLLRSRGKALSPAVIEERLIPGGSDAIVALARRAPLMSGAELAEAIMRTDALRGMSAEDLRDARRFDAAADALVAGRMTAARRAAGGAEPVLAYVLGREAEVLLLRTALLGRLAGLDREVIRARVKERLA